MREDVRRRRPLQPKRFLHRLFLADRSMSLGLGITTMTATWVGGGYLNGTAEAVYTHGVLYCHVPIGYAISLVLGGCFFAQKMRTTNAVTMLDPFQEQYGRWMGLLLCLPAVCGEIFWTAAMLAALGDAAGSLMEVDSKLFIVIAAATIFFYTALGGQYSVAYTDVLQICITIVFMWVCVPYVVKGRAVGTVHGPETNWIGDIPLSKAGQLLDAFLMTALGGIPWQVYFQCVLGCNSDFAAVMLSYMAALGCIIMAVPPMIIGAAAKTTNFTAAGYPGPWQLREQATVLPQALRYLTPAAISVLGMLAITAAVMSSADSSMFSASTMVTKNVYHVLLRPSASESEVALTLRIVVCLVGAAAAYLAMSVQSVFGLWTLCSEVVYVLLFPQLVCVFYLKNTNTYGSVIAFVLGAFSRWLCSDPSLSLLKSIQLPLYDQERELLFPFRLACMVIGFFALIAGSVVAAMAFEKRWLPPHYDVFGCFREPQPGDTASRRNDTLWTRECAEEERSVKAAAEYGRSELTNRSERSQLPSRRSRATSVNVTEISTKMDRSKGAASEPRGRRRRSVAASAVTAKTPEATAKNDRTGNTKQRRRSAKQAGDDTPQTVKDAEVSAAPRHGRKPRDSGARV
ncbi:hypothetical protein HPB50_014014 [Hyalomma asiaticum]|uniref:Uncharacterized protein n=1 Tax=Hyalomma asiaticum TaxID=266040 RepID=A0ACB7SEB9_HYAAI|nr:hypothetical protein HPB50_014014 [Hyalomma asiaticum]